MQDYYNVTGYYYGSSNLLSSSTSRIINKLIEALNENDKLLHIIIIMMDKDVMADLKSYDYGASRNISNLVNWITRQYDIMIHREQLQIVEKKPGAVTRDDPIVIYTSMIHRVEIFHQDTQIASICKMRLKFNDILNEAVARQSENNHIMNFHSCNTLDHFDRSGNLSAKGKTALWYEIDDIIEKFESGDRRFTLLPQTSSNY